MAGASRPKAKPKGKGKAKPKAKASSSAKVLKRPSMKKQANALMKRPSKKSHDDANMDLEGGEEETMASPSEDIDCSP
eukprot:5382412-Alexandrium_andersonii.AAC.1